MLAERADLAKTLLYRESVSIFFNTTSTIALGRGGHGETT